jgi:phosphoserine aminotransferase
MLEKPLEKPAFPYFSSGPTKKYPTYSSSKLVDALVSRSHRTPEGIDVLNQLLKDTREVLKVPDDYKIALIPGSATGAIECALWSFLGARGVDVFSWEVFGKLWILDVVNQLKLEDIRLFEADFGDLPDLSAYNADRDLVFVWNGTTSGVCVPNLDWIPSNRQGLTICDATSAAFCVPLEWEKLDVTTFSWQKGLGGEAGHGMMVLSPRALERLQTYTPPWPIPRLFRLIRNNQIYEGVFKGETINTPSMLCAQDCLNALAWAKSVGGIDGLFKRCLANFQVIKEWVDASDQVKFMAQDTHYTSPVSVTIQLQETISKESIQNAAQILKNEGVAYDIVNHKLAPASFRIWCGPTVDANDVKNLTLWLDYALKKVQNV